MDRNLLNLITIKETDFIGTYKDPKVIYKTDIDLQEYVYKKNDSYSNVELENIRRFFINIFDNCKKPNCIITDFKMGHFGANVPIRWTYKDLKKGYIIIDNNNKKRFIDLLNQRSIIKIDFLTLDDNFILNEVSKNFYFIFKDLDTRPLEIIYQDISISFLKDYYKYKELGNIYKAFKRLYSYYKINNDETQQNILLKKINNSNLAIPYIKKYKTELIDLYFKFVKVDKNIKDKIIEANT